MPRFPRSIWETGRRRRPPTTSSLPPSRRGYALRRTIKPPFACFVIFAAREKQIDAEAATLFLRLFLLSKRSSRVTCYFVGFLTAPRRGLVRHIASTLPRHTRSLRCLPRPEIISNFTQWLDRKNKLEEWITNRRRGRKGRHNERASLHPSARRLSPKNASWGRMAK